MNRIIVQCSLLTFLAACSSSAATDVSDATLPDIPDVPASLDSMGEVQPSGELTIPHFFPPTVAVGGALDLTFQALGGSPPYTEWTVIQGDLPPGTSLDPATGRWTGTPEEEGVHYFVIGVTDDAGTTASELFGIRVCDPAEPGPLARRADEYQVVYEARHLWHGMSYGNWTPDDPGGDLQLSTLGDATFVSGNCTQAMAFRYAADPSPDALAVVTEQMEGWRFFQALTGVKGLVGRSFMKVTDPVEHFIVQEWDNPEQDWHLGTGDFDGWVWKGDTSRDQVSGAVLGIATAYDVVDDDHVKGLAREFMVDLADHVWENDLRMVDPDGLPTTHGDVSGERLEGFPFPNGQAATCSLAWFKAAHHMSGEDRFRERYEELLLERDYLSILRDYQWVYVGYGTKWFNTYISWENFYQLMRLEDDPTLADELRAVFRDTLWLNTDDESPNRSGIKEHNPVKTPWYLFSTGERDPVSLFHALWQVVVFPEAPLRDRKVENSKDPSIEINPEKTDEALYPLPSDKRPPDMVIWHRSPFALDGGADTGEERTGCDYLLPYWMGRYYGFIGKDW